MDLRFPHWVEEVFGLFRDLCGWTGFRSCAAPTRCCGMRYGWQMIEITCDQVDDEDEVPGFAIASGAGHIAKKDASGAAIYTVSVPDVPHVPTTTSGTTADASLLINPHRSRRDPKSTCVQSQRLLVSYKHSLTLPPQRLRNSSLVNVNITKNS
jgi:hypothetical protein